MFFTSGLMINHPEGETMFVKAIRSGEHTYLQIVRSVRKNGVPTHEVMADLGRVDRLAGAQLDQVIDALQKYAVKRQTSGYGHLRDLRQMAEKDRVNYGWVVYRKLWAQFGLGRFLQKLSSERKISYDYAAVVFALVVNHVLNPSSKRDFYQNQGWYSGLTAGIELQHLYRSLDLLAEHKAELELLLFHQHRTLFEMKVDVVFFDVTTFYFESQQADTLREFGYSKDNKLNEVQVVLALLIDGAGRPISFELFPGNTFEGHTLVAVLDQIKDRFQIGRVMIVADKGINSKLNLKAIKERGYDYLVSCRIKHLPETAQGQVLAKDGYEQIALKDVFGVDDDELHHHTFQYKVLDYRNIVRYKDDPAQKHWQKAELAEKLICSWSSKRAAKDLHDRDRQVAKAQQVVDANQKSVLKHRGYQRYIKADGHPNEEVRLSLDQNKIDAEARFDGFAAIQCSQQDISPIEMRRAYRQLLKIEESFRVMKTTLRTRPVFVWTPEHVKGHFVMCFLAFALERELEYRLNKRNIDNSPEKIKAALRSMQCSQIEIEKETYYLKGKHESLASEIFALLKIKKPTNICNQSQWTQYLKQA